MNTAAEKPALHCRVSGEGPAALTLHGGMGGIDQSIILAQALGLTNGFKTIAVARPGYPGTRIEAGRTPDEQADLYVALLDRLGVDKVLVAAVSAGGPSAICFAIRHSDRCRGLILTSCCTGHLAVPESVMRRLPAMRIMAKVPLLSSFLSWRSARNPERSAARSIEDPELRSRTLADPEAGPLMRALQQSVFDDMAGRLVGTINDMEQFGRMTTLPYDRIAAPVLVVHGTGDRIVPFEHGERVAHAAPNAELMAIEGGEHVSLFTHLHAIRARVATFTATLS
jgi:pimeloyl-ACP methyl ester carboxylesterase